VAGGAVLSIQRRFTLSQLLVYLWRPLLLVVTVGLVATRALSTAAILATYVAAGLVQVVGVFAALRRSPSGTAPLPTARLVTEGLLFGLLHDRDACCGLTRSWWRARGQAALGSYRRRETSP
jgi:hypothetical protein